MTNLIVRGGRPLRGEITPSANKNADRKSTRLNSSHVVISYAVFCLKKKKNKTPHRTLASLSFDTNTCQLHNSHALHS